LIRNNEEIPAEHITYGISNWITGIAHSAGAPAPEREENHLFEGALQ